MIEPRRKTGVTTNDGRKGAGSENPATHSPTHRGAAPKCVCARHQPKALGDIARPPGWLTARMGVAHCKGLDSVLARRRIGPPTRAVKLKLRGTTHRHRDYGNRSQLRPRRLDRLVAPETKHVADDRSENIREPQGQPNATFARSALPIRSTISPTGRPPRRQ